MTSIINDNNDHPSSMTSSVLMTSSHIRPKGPIPRLSIIVEATAKESDQARPQKGWFSPWKIVISPDSEWMTQCSPWKIGTLPGLTSFKQLKWWLTPQKNLLQPRKVEIVNFHQQNGRVEPYRTWPGHRKVGISHINTKARYVIMFLSRKGSKEWGLTKGKKGASNDQMHCIDKQSGRLDLRRDVGCVKFQDSWTYR